ncbi:MAG: TonB-dependent receptor plug domain-containing protein, partial [Bacteroidota bacterium]
MQAFKTRRNRIRSSRALGFWIAITINYYGLTAQITTPTKDTSDRLEEIVISGTLQEVSKSSSTVPIELYTAQFFRSNPAPSLFEGLFQVNGVQPQVNCNVCSAGDIHINGMEGPYTLVLIDGMPIVSGLSTVYGLFGIPQSLIDRVEIVKGPASTLYGSEAVGGLINVITKKSSHAPRFVVDLLQNSWGEFSADIGGKLTIAKNHHLLLGLNSYNYQQLHDKNKDNFTDIPLVQRASAFAKWNIQRKEFRTFSVAMRWVGENRWGGDIRWNEQFQGGDSIYGEQIATNRWEIFGTYQLPTIENIKLQF